MNSILKLSGATTLRIISLAGVLTVAVYLIPSSADAGGVIDLASGMSLAPLTLVLALSLANYALRYLRWRYYIQMLGHHIPGGTHLAIYLAGFALTATPGKAGEAIRTVYLSPYGVGATESIGVLLLERVLDLAAIALLSLLLFANLTIFIVASWASALALVLLFRSHDLNWLRRVRCPTFFKGLDSLRRRLPSSHVLVRFRSVLLRPFPLVLGMALGLAAWFAEAYGVYILVIAVKAQIPVLAAAGAYAASILVGALSMLPGGLGSTEAAMTLLLREQGLSINGSLAVTMICRLATLWFAVGIGLLALAWLGLAPGTAMKKTSR